MNGLIPTTVPVLLTVFFFLTSNPAISAGIGIYLAHCEGRFYVSRIINNSPASKAGLNVGDEIVEVNNENVRGKKFHQVIEMLRGKRGSRVEILDLRDGIQQEISIKLDKVKIPPHEHRMLTSEIGYLRFSSNYAKIHEIRDIFSRFHENSAKSLIFDFRDFGGLRGLKNDLYLIKIFSGGRTLGYMVDTQGKRAELKLLTKTVEEMTPVVILVNGGTAGGGEMITLALREYGKAYVIGTKTRGNTFTIRQNSEIPTHRYVSPNGVDVHEKGIEPDRIYSSDKCGVVTDDVIDAAVAYLQRELAK